MPQSNQPQNGGRKKYDLLRLIKWEVQHCSLVQNVSSQLILLKVSIFDNFFKVCKFLSISCACNFLSRVPVMDFTFHSLYISLLPFYATIQITVEMRNDLGFLPKSPVLLLLPFHICLKGQFNSEKILH